MDISVKTGLSKSRIETFNKFHIKHVSKSRFIELALLLIFFVTGVLFIFVWENSIGVVVSFSAMVLQLLTFPYRVYVAVKKQLKTAPMDSRSYKVRFTDEGIDFERGEEIKFYKWKEITRICEIYEFFYIYVSNSQAIIIPKYVILQNKRKELEDVMKRNCKYRKYGFKTVEEVEGVV